MSALTARLRSVSPFGPIFGKELRVSGRRKRTYLLRVLYLAALLMVMGLAWTGTRYAYGPGTAAARAQAQEQLGSAFFICFVGFTTVAMLLIGPVLTSTAISSERLGRTLNVLLAAPITTWQVIGGKLASRLLIALTLIGLSLPVLALSRLLGGLELSQMIGGLCVPATAAVFAAAVGLFFSTVLRRAFAVILLAYFALGVIEMFVPFVMMVAFNAGAGPRGDMLWANFNLFAAMVSVMEPGVRGRGGNPLGLPLDAWLVGCLLHLVVASVLVFCSGLLLRRVARSEGGGATGIDPSEHIPVATIATEVSAETPVFPPLSDEAAAAPEAATGPRQLAYSTPAAGGSRAARPRDVADNPVLWREVRRPLTSRRWQAVLFSALVVLLLLISYATIAAGGGRGLAEPDVQIGYAIIFNGVLWLLVAVISATSVAQEKESDTWTLLLTTPLSGRAIVFGKAIGLLRRFVWPYALMAAHFALFTLFGVIRPDAFVLAVWVIVTFNSIWIATGIYLSLRLRSTTFAVIANLLLAIIVYPGVAVGLLIATELTSSRYDAMRRNGAWSEQVAWYLPYSYLAMGMDGLERAGGAALAPYTDERFWLPCDPLAEPPPPNSRNYYNSPYYQRRVSGSTYFGVVFAVGLGYLLAALLLLYWTARRFDRIVRRARQQEPIGPSTARIPAAALRA